MPPSPALRSSPGREPRGSNHKRGHSFESAVRIREKDDDLALFNDMQTREREGFLLQSAEDLEDSFSTKLRHFSDLKLGISIPVRGENSDLLNNNVEADKNDYDWLLTPPDTPLFPSLDDEPPPVTISSRGRPRSQPISISRSSTMEKSHRSSTSRGSPSPNRLSPSPRSANSVPQLRGRQLSAPHSSPTPNLRHATPSRRSTTPTRRSSPPSSTPPTSMPRSSTPTPRRLSTGSSGTAVISGAMGTSPIKSVRGNSASPKIRAWQTNIPGFSSDPPPNLRTSLADRPASYVRGSSPASRNSRDLAPKYGRQSMSPTASRRISSSHSHDRDRYSSYSRGSIASSGDDDLDSLQSIPISSLENSLSKGGISVSNNKALAFSKKHGIVSSSSAPKRSLDSTIRHLDRKSPNMFRPLLSSVPSTTFYTGKASSAHRSLISRNSSVTTSSNASSDHGTYIALDTEGSDHNQDDMANECEKIPYHESHEEIFAFDKMDIVDEDPIHDIKSLDGGPALGCDPVVTGDGSYEAVIPDISSTSDSSHVQGGDFSEIVCLEDTVVCSRCGCRYRVIDTEENNVNLCPECSREDRCVGSAISENMTSVTENLSGLSSVKYEEDKLFNKVESLVISPDSSLAIDLGESRISMSVGNVEQDQASYPEQGPSYVDENFPSETPVEESQHSLINHLEMGQSAVSGSQPDTGSGYQQPLPHNDYQSLRFDSPDGAGISILLKRSSSSKGPVVQGRTFTASTISYDDLSFARDSMSSLRSSIGHSSFSASSSADFSSDRQIEARMQRQLSSRKGDLENKKGEISLKSHCSEVASTGIPANAHPISGFETCKQEENVDLCVANLDCFSSQKTTMSSQKPELASENAESDDTSSLAVADVVEEDKLECDKCRILDTCTSELSREDSSGGRSVSDKDASLATSDCSKLEGHNMLDDDVFEDERTELSTHPMATISETEAIQIAEVIAPGSQDDLSTISKIPLEEESVVPSGPDQDLTPSVINPEKSDDIIEESTVIVDYQGKTKVVRSLTLEEATDTILFCSSIVHDLAYSAATIAIEKEKEKEKDNEVTLEASRPMVTILGKSNTNRSDLRHRAGGKRVMKSQKPRQRLIEMSTKPPIAKTENDENNDESTIRNVGLPNQVDTTKPPKLESKCNCSIM